MTAHKIMPSFRNKRLSSRNSFSFKKPGTAPGSAHHIGEKRTDQVTFNVHVYDKAQLKEFQVQSIEEGKKYLDDAAITWIEVRGLHDIEKLRMIWNYFQLHPLIQEDIANTEQRTKMEQYESCTFFVMRMLYQLPKSDLIESEQISIVLGKNYILSFQETDAPLFDAVTQRLVSPKNRIRSSGPDYIAYALIDTIVDHYFNLTGILGERIDKIEERLMDDPQESILQDIHRLHKEIIYSRKAIWPTRELLNMSLKEDSPFIQKSTRVFLRDVHDHAIHANDMIENYRDMIMGMHNIYMSQASNKMNEVMKLLTIIATIFIPLTFIAGVYGMNFNPEASPYNMPELGWYWGYPAALAVMLVVALIMVVYFKRKNWL